MDDDHPSHGPAPRHPPDPTLRHAASVDEGDPLAQRDGADVPRQAERGHVGADGVREPDRHHGRQRVRHGQLER